MLEGKYTSSKIILKYLGSDKRSSMLFKIGMTETTFTRRIHAPWTFTLLELSKIVDVCKMEDKDVLLIINDPVMRYNHRIS